VRSRIALSGCGGSGKSTLAKALADRLNYPRIDEGVREWMRDNGVTHLREMTPADTLKMQDEMLQKKRAHECALPYFVADRSTADNLAYALRWCARDVSEMAINQYKILCQNHAEHNYDLILFLPWGRIPLVDDGVRSANHAYQYEISCLIRGILDDWGMPVCTVEATSLNDRVDEAIRAIGAAQ